MSSWGPVSPYATCPRHALQVPDPRDLRSVAFAIFEDRLLRLPSTSLHILLICLRLSLYQYLRLSALGMGVRLYT